ncbi:MAG: hypothetical protein R6W31_11845 [Bacteroidales bacterium]
MKIIAFILMVSTGFLGLNRFMSALDWMAPQAEMSCSMDHCGGQNGCCCCDQHGDEGQKSDHGPENGNQCQDACDCAYSIQIIAIGTPIQSPVELSQHLFVHGVNSEHYQSQYLPPHFQPPRMV